MLREVYVVKNNTVSDIELKDFGIVITPGEIVELGEYDKAVMSTELYDLLTSGDLVRYIDNIEVTDAQFLYSTSNNYYLTDEQYGNVINVAKTGSTLTTINDALDAIIDNDINNRYLIQVSPDLFIEDIVMKPYVTIRGLSTFARIQGKVTVDFTGSTNSIILDNLEIQNFEEETFYIDTDGVVIFKDVVVRTDYTISSPTRVKSMFNIKSGIVNLIGSSSVLFTNTISGTTNNVDTIYYVQGTGFTNLISFNTTHHITTYEQNTYVTVVYNENTNINTSLSVKDSFVFYYLYNNNPLNKIIPILQSGATNTSSVSLTRFYIEAPDNNYMNGVKFISVYNTNSYGVISNVYSNFNLFTWNNNHISDECIFIAAATTILDNVRVLNCFYKTLGDIIPAKYETDGNSGEIYYSITNNEGTQANFGQIRMSSLYIGTDISANGGTVIDRILNENDFISDSQTGLATQHSIKEYVHSQISGITTDTLVQQSVFDAYTGTTGLQEITDINAITDNESSFNSGIITNRIKPNGDTTTAIQISKNDNTPIINIDTVSGFTGFGIVEPETLIHSYGTDINNDSLIGLQTNGIKIDGVIGADKDIQWSEDGIVHWIAQTYRNEHGKYWYLYNQEGDVTPIVVSDTGRIGINSPTNIINKYALSNNNTGLDDIRFSGLYDKNFVSIFNIEIDSIGTPDTFRWRVSYDEGDSFSTWISGVSISTEETLIESGVYVYFLSETGHTLSTSWEKPVFPQLPHSTFTIHPNGFSEILLTDDYSDSTITYKNYTGELNSSREISGIQILTSGSSMGAFYVGTTTKLNAIFFNIITGGEDILLITEYWDGTDWIDISIGNSAYLNNTNNLKQSGGIYWETNEMVSWIRADIQDFQSDEELYWIRVRSASNVTKQPLLNNIGRNGKDRFTVYSSPYDYKPCFFVDLQGRTNIGGGAITRKNKLQISTVDFLDVAVGSASLVEMDSNDANAADLRIKLTSDDAFGTGIAIVKTRGELTAAQGVQNGDEIGHIWFRARVGSTGATLNSIVSIYTGNGDSTSILGDLIFKTASGSSPLPVERVRINHAGYTGFGVSNPESIIHLLSGSTSVSPLKFNSGSLLTIPQTGAIEFVNDEWYGTITTGIERKTFAFLESPQFIGNPNLPIGTTFNLMNLYDFIITSGGSSSTVLVTTTTFNSFTGTTAPDTYVSKSTYNTFTGTTGLNEITQINAYTGVETLFYSGISTTQIRSTSNETINIKDYLGDTKITIRTDSGFTGFGTMGATNQIHVFGTDTTSGDLFGLQTNGIRLDGGVGTDKQVQWAEDDTVKWLAETYRNENGKFWYLWSQENESAPIVASQGGRVGINNPSNIMGGHTLKIVGDGDTAGAGLYLSGLYNKNFLLVYQVKINSTTGVTDTFVWRMSKDEGLTYGSWSDESVITLSPILFSNGIELNFEQITGNTVGDTWEFGAFPQLPLGTFVVTPIGFTEILKTDDYTAGTVIYEDKTSIVQNSNSSFFITLLNTGTTDSAIYIGALLEFDSIFFNLLNNGSGINIITEYWDGNLWIDMSIGTDYYLDKTDNFTHSGEIVWDSTILTGWDKYFLPNQTEEGYDLFWVRIRSNSSPTSSPTVDTLVRGGNKRLAVNSSPLSYKPSFYVDSLGRVNIGGGSITGKNKFQINDANVTQYSTGLNSIAEIDTDDSDAALFRLKLASDDKLGFRLGFGKYRGTLENGTSILPGDSLGNIRWGALIGSPANVSVLADIGVEYVGDGQTVYGDIVFQTNSNTIGLNTTEKVRISENGTGFGITVPTARIHIQSGSTTVAPLRFTSGSLLSSPQTGAVEFVGDSWYGTTTSSTRKTFAFLESPQFTGTPNLPIGITLNMMNLYDFILTSGGTSSTGFVTVSTFNSYTGTTDTRLSTDESNFISFTGTTNGNITSLSTSISSETSTRGSVDSSLSLSISSNTSKEASLSTSIISEVSTRSSVDSSLSTILSTVISEGTSDNSSLSTAILLESSTRVSVDNSLSTSVLTEVSTRTNVDSSLSTSISQSVTGITSLSIVVSSETISRTSVDSSLSTTISNETSLRSSVDSSLSTRISSEISTRGNVDSSLSTTISSETSTRGSADASLSIAVSTEMSLFNAYTGSTIPWTQVSKSGSTLVDIETRNAEDINISVPDWDSNNIDDLTKKIVDYIDDTQGSGRLAPEIVLLGTGTDNLIAVSGSGYITYTGYHRRVSWSTTIFSVSGYTNGVYYAYVDNNSEVLITLVNPNNINSIRLGLFYVIDGAIATIQQCGCIVLNSLKRNVDFALRLGAFIYDGGGSINLMSGSTQKITSSAAKVQYGFIDFQLSKIDSDDSYTGRFGSVYMSADYDVNTNYYFNTGGNGGRIPTIFWNDVTKKSYVPLTGNTATFTSGSTSVTSPDNLTSFISVDTIIYLDDDGEFGMNRVTEITWTGSETQITLSSPYVGVGGTGVPVANYALPLIPAGKWVKFLIVRTTDDLMALIPSQVYYDSEDDAKTAPLPLLPPSLNTTALKIANIVFEQGESDLTGKIYDIRPLPFYGREGGVLGGGTSISNHGDLQGLENDDHQQYLKTDGTRLLSGIQKYQSQPSFSTDLDVITKKYVDDLDLLKTDLTTFNIYTGITNGNISSLSISISTEISTRSSVDLSLSTEVSIRSSVDSLLSTSISIEVSTRTSADTSLTTRISTEESKVVSLSTTLSTEVSTRSSADLSLSSGLSTEVLTRTSSVTSLSTTLSTSISTEVSTRTSVDNSLSVSISTRTSVDNSLSTSISTEISTRSSVDNSLSTGISTRISVDNSLSIGLSTEVSTRNSEDVSLSNGLSTETSIRSSVDSSLSTSLSLNISTDISAHGSLSIAISQGSVGFTSLSSSISTEISTRSSADSSLSTIVSTTISTVNTKQDTITGAAITITGDTLTINRAVISDGNGNISVSNTTSTQIGYLGTLTSDVQTQMNTKATFLSPSLSGTPTSTTAVVNTNTTQIATTAFVVGQASSTNPLMNGTVAIGTSLRYSRENHVHPSDTSRLSVTDFNTFTGTTLPSFYVSLSTYNTFTGTTNTNLSTLSGWTGTKLDTSLFNTYTIITAPSSFVSKSTFNIYTGDTSTVLAGKQNTITGGAITITGDTLTINRAVVSDGNGNISISTTTSTQIGYLNTLTSNVQTQINLKSPLASPTFTGIPAAPTASVNTNTTQIATTAYVVGQASSTNPLMNGSVSIGTSLRYSREDHVHASDTSRLALVGGTMTGTLNGTNINLSADLRVTGSTYLYNTTSGTSSNILVIDSVTKKVGDSGLVFNVYGSEYQLASDLTSTSTNSTSPITKLTMTTTDLPTGTYKVMVNWIWNRNSAANSARFDVQLNGTTQGTRTMMEMEAGDTTDYRPEYRVFYFSLSGVNTIVLRHWGESTGNSTTTSDATIELIRVS